MGRNKEHLNQLLILIQKLYKEPDNTEFIVGIQNMVGFKSSKSTIDSEKINEIYELCLEKNAKEQALGLYDGFPYDTIKDSLMEDFVIMERFRRRGDFLNYSAHLFLQIENICNTVCGVEMIQEIHSSLMKVNIPAYINGNDIKQRNTDNGITIGKLLYGDYEFIERDNGKKIDKKTLPLSDLGMFDKIKSVLYLAGFGGRMFSSNWNEWQYNTNLMYDIYVIRCQADHRGVAPSEKQENRITKILENKNRNYAIFFSVLVYFVNKITDGKKLIEPLLEYSKTLSIEKKEGIVTKILPSAICVQFDDGQTKIIPASTYKKKNDFKEGMHITATFNGDTIVQIFSKQ